MAATVEERVDAAYASCTHAISNGSGGDGPQYKVTDDEYAMAKYERDHPDELR